MFEVIIMDYGFFYHVKRLRIVNNNFKQIGRAHV